MSRYTENLYNLYREHPVISTDSRTVAPGSLFFSLRGENFNGNKYAAAALSSGAAYAVVDDPALAETGNFILVEDVLAELQALALHHRKQFGIPVIAITGSNGKTTTKELINAVLSSAYTTVATSGNLNNHIGVPLTLLRITGETQIAIIEMGANHPGEIGFLCGIALPTHGIITNIGKAHLEGFGGFEGVIRTKTELYRYLAESGGVVFLNNDDELLVEKASGLHQYTYGKPPADIEVESFICNPFVTMVMNLPARSGTTGETYTSLFQEVQNDQKTIKETLALSTRLYGSYNTSNVAAAACIGRYFGVPLHQISTSVNNYEPVNNRSQLLKTDSNLLILDAYNANPSSMEAALKSFAATDYLSKTVILGDMLELGNESDDEHLRILKLLEKQNLEAVYLVGPQFTRLNTKREYLCFADSELARMWFDHYKPAGASILIKGSRGIRLENIVGAL